MDNDKNTNLPTEEYRAILHKKMLNYGLITSVVGLPVGLILNMPVVWGLAILGIIIGGIKIMKRKN